MTEPATELPAIDPELSAARKGTRRKWLKRLAIALGVVGLAWAAWYLLVTRNHVGTDNAYVNAQIAQVTPLVAGSAIEVLVEDTQQVKAGDVLVRLDQANAKIAVAQAQADLAAARRREDSSDSVGGSVFEEFRKGNSGRFIVVEAIERLIQSTKAPYIVLSYSSGGRATAEELTDILSANGDVIDMMQISHKKNVMAHMKWTNDWLRDAETDHLEYLFLLRKN